MGYRRNAAWFSQLVFTCTGEWGSRSVSTLCNVISCPRERYVSVSFVAIVSILCVSGFRAVSFEFWSFELLIANHSHF